MNKLLPFIILIFTLSACGIGQNDAIAPPVKPQVVPDNTLWIGGQDGGVFVVISEGEDNNIYFGTIYFDSTGEIWYQGEFKYTGMSPFDVNDRTSYRGWDGDVLYLQNGEKLIAVDAIK